jgi:hypothetical protein
MPAVSNDSEEFARFLQRLSIEIDKIVEQVRAEGVELPTIVVVRFRYDWKETMRFTMRNLIDRVKFLPEENWINIINKTREALLLYLNEVKKG